MRIGFFMILAQILGASPPLFVGGVGLFDIGDTNQGMVLLEYRGGHPTYHVHTQLGTYLSTNESFYGYFGLGYDASIGEKYKLTPSFAAGYYARGNGKDMGYPILFRPGIEFSRVYSNNIRIGLQYTFLSNFGIDSFNPGSHNLILLFAIPLNFIL